MAQIQLIRDLSMKKAVALAIKLHRYVERLPKEMLELANENQLPILEIPIDVAWIEIISPVLSQIHVSSLKLLSYSKNVHDRFTNLVLEGGNIEDIGQTLRELIGRDVHIARINEYSHEEFNEFPQQEITPIKVSGRSLGRITIDLTNGSLRNEDLVAVEHAATVSALTFLKVDAVTEAERRYRNEFLSSLLDRTIEDRDEVLTRAHTFNWDLSGAFAVFVIEIDISHKHGEDKSAVHSKHRYLTSSIVEIIKEIVNKCMYLDRENRLIVFLPENRDRYDLNNCEGAKRVGKLIYKQLANYYIDIDFFIGIGRLRKDIITIYESYQEAVSALRLRRSIFCTEKIVHFEDLGIYKLLFEHHLEQEFIKFEQEIFMGLNGLKESNRVTLLSTLHAYFKYQCNINHTAKVLMIHPNTLRYRLGKLKKFCDIDLNDNEHKLKAQVALKIAELNNRL